MFSQLQASQAHSNSQIIHQLDEQSRLITAIRNSQSESRNSIQLPQPQEQLPFSQSTAPSPVPWPTIHVRTTYMPRDYYSICHPSCRCPCHIFHRFQSPSLLDRLIGALFIGYSGYSGAFSKCTVKSCRAQSNFRVAVNYMFPPWLVRNTLISICFQKLSNRITVNLTVKNMLPLSAPIFQYVASNNIDGLRRLFDDRLARPSDIRYGDGWDALHVSNQSF